MNYPNGQSAIQGIDQLAKDSSRLHEHSPLPLSPSSDASRSKVPSNRGRVQLSADMIREGNRIIEQLYVDEIINAIDDVIGLTAEKLMFVFADREDFFDDDTI